MNKSFITTIFFAITTSLSASEIKIDNASIQKHIEALSKIGNLGAHVKDGFTRNAWSIEETAAFKYIEQEGINIGLEPHYDEVGNLFLRTKNKANKVIQTGSHLDTVPSGGNFDGAAGVIAGLEAIHSIIKKGVPKETDLELVVWRGEESTSYGTANKGSKLAFGENIHADKKLKEAIEQQGFKISSAKHTPTQPSAYFELHIEQGNKLELDKKEIGIVTSIRGADRYRIEVSGKFDHSGATPMGTKYRSDANLTIAYMQVELDKLIKNYLERGYDLVQTVGVVNSDKEINNSNKSIYDNAMTKVSGFGYFVLDLRSNNKKQRQQYVERALATLKQTSLSFNTRLKITHISDSDPAESLDPKLEKSIEAATKLLGYSYTFLPSGAGHDAAIVAKHGIPSAMIFIPCKDGTSHSKEEFAKTNDIKKGAEVLASTMLSI
jgi:hydantoinase/carbamoylase family amidase